MSLATRCTACGTVFRVVQDQLKVSEGWVRCGRCSEVFNALEGLFDLEGSSGPTPLARDADDSIPTALSASSSSSAAPLPTPASPTEASATDDDAPTTQLDTRADSSSFGRSRPPVDDDDLHDRSTLDSRARYDTLDSEVPGDNPWAPEPTPTPAFLREQQAAAAWQRPRVQRSLKVLAALLLIGLVLQVGLTQRDALSVRWPAAAPLLSALCAGCSIEAPRELEMLAVDSSGLTHVEGSPTYRFQVALRNRGAHAVAMPALDLALTDLRGEVIVRRVLQPGDLAGAAAPAVLGGGSTWSVNALLDVAAETRVAGYTVELFYP